MTCTNCGAENRPERRFCLECGTALEHGCPNCGAANEPEARFCGNCGRPLATSQAVAAEPAAPFQANMPTAPSAAAPSAVASAGAHPTTAVGQAVAERRLVSVLFADLVGFTPFAEERDAEDVRDTLERYFDLARQVVERYGGSIEKFIGDAVMAVWGTPTAHEDDAERGVRAALELVETVRTLGAGIEARAGVLTGEAAVSRGATEQGMLAGDLVNTAARLQSVAPAGTVLVGESTMLAASAALAFEPVGDQALKGKTAPVPAWRALRVVAQRRGVGRSQTLETPFVGREEEFRQLRELLHLSGRDPRARLVSITGPAGIGKSRLAWELEKYVDGVVERIYWHRGRCPAYGEGVSFWALGEMVRSRAGLAESDDETVTRQRVMAMVEEYVGDAAQRTWIHAALLALLGLEPTPPGGREMLFAAWRLFFEDIAARGTTVLVFEDLQWADSGLLDFIDHLLDWSKSAPLLVVTLARPELFERRPQWGAGRRAYTAMALDPLSERAMRELLAGLIPELPERALQQIVDRADGIPLYAVETVRMLLADGRLVQSDGACRPTGELGDLAVPDSLRSLITSRLDALTREDRTLLQDASVLGQSFALDALAAVSALGTTDLEPRLRQLVRRELLTLQADARSPERGQYGFMQSVIREVAYSTLGRRERRARHLAAARHFEALGADELAGVLAGHYLAAYETSTAGPEQEAVATQARLALLGAAERAAALGSHLQAAAYLDQALAVTQDASEQARMLERQAKEFDTAGRYERGEAASRQAIEIYEQSGDQPSVARTRGLVGALLIHAAKPADALVELERALAELPEEAEPAVRADVLAKLAWAHYRNLQAERSIEMADQALRLAEHHNLYATVAEALVSKGTALRMVGHNHEAMAVLRGGIELARREGDIRSALRGTTNIGGLLARYDSFDPALAITRDGYELARSVGDLGDMVWLLGNIAIGSCYAGLQLDPLLTEIQEVLALDLEQGDRHLLTGRYLRPALLRGRDVSQELAWFTGPAGALDDPQASGEIDDVLSFRAIAEDDYQAASEHVERFATLKPTYGEIGEAALYAALAGDASRVRRLLEIGRQHPLNGRPDEAMRAAARAAMMALEGRVAEALPAFREALRVFSSIASRLHVGLLGLAMARILGPQQPDARAAAEDALGIFEHMGSEPLAGQVRAALAGTAQPAGAPGSERSAAEARS